ncbi:MAG: hypothetical protein HXY25_07835 [Alphaproteobacteria bacterium]|nr:hypothetical protein [Alphaproteobacteria bacterium]
MRRHRFARYARAYGGDIERWPAGVRAAAYAFAEDDPAAEGILAEACRLDRALDRSARAGKAVPSDDLAFAVALIPARHARRAPERGMALRPSWLGLAPAARPAPLAAAVLLALTIGYSAGAVGLAASMPDPAEPPLDMTLVIEGITGLKGVPAS